MSGRLILLTTLKNGIGLFDTKIKVDTNTKVEVTFKVVNEESLELLFQEI
jgi:hypothetical protein